MTIEPIIECRGVSKVYLDADRSVAVVNDVTFALGAHEFVALMGPSGSGKSTVLHLCAALETANSGMVMVDGHDVASLTNRRLAELRRKTVGVVFQRLNLVPSLTALENVALPMELDGVRRKLARGDAAEALKAVGIGELAGRFPDRLSGGEQQRVAIARAIVGERKVILADEPTAALDTLSGDVIVELLRQLQEDRQLAVMLVTHEPRFASWADRVVFLRDGQLIDTTALANQWGPSAPTADLMATS
jgi:putative ABC transport system ATP-binding protein